MAQTDRWNTVRYHGESRGHYESWFIRANHPTQPKAFWIRYTIFSPKGRPHDAVGERWAIAFDGTTDRVVAAKSVVPLAECHFSDHALDVRIGDGTLAPGRAVGDAAQGDTRLTWDVELSCDKAPVLVLPERLYRAALPKAKVVVPQPNARFDGHLTVDGERWDIDGWTGSQNHNWGSKHTDFYAWGQVAGFDDAPGVFLECATAKLKLGPLWTPPLSIAVVRLPDAEIRLNTIRQAIRANAKIDGVSWTMQSKLGDVELEVQINAPESSFVGLTYANPPGGAKTCLNTKLARCTMSLRRPGHDPLELTTSHRAAFEILTDDPPSNIPVVA